MDLTTGWIEVLAGVASLVFLAVISMFVEALRRPPKPPEKLAWAPGIPIRYVSVGGVKLRYIKAGAGPNLVLLHTLRTQLDIFQKVIPELSREFTVYAPDYPRRLRTVVTSCPSTSLAPSLAKSERVSRSD